VLTHPARLAILEILRQGEECVCHLEAYLGYRQAYLSQQLSVLRQAGLVQVRKDGRNVFYHVVEPKIYEILDAAHNVVCKGELPVRDIKDCPCPKCSQKERVY
ncbi:MAG: metalloregulator ArsR/SmtB family transcription factor, partial [Chloroflexota bacterium]